MANGHGDLDRFRFTPLAGTAEEREEEEELEPLLADEEQMESGPGQPPAASLPCALNPHAHLPVYATIHRIRRDVIASIDDPYSLEQLKSPRMNISIVRPLVDRYYDLQDISTVYCLLVNRVHFLREQTGVHHHSVNLTRALLCEVVASKIIRRYDDDHPGPKGLLLLANILIAGFEPFQNCPSEVADQNAHVIRGALQKRGGYERKKPALEMAIISESKIFLSTAPCQKVVDAIYIGRVVYTPTSFIDILPDHYKHKPISLYDPRAAPLLNQYRLIVPRTRNLIEVCHFVILLVLYILVMSHRDGVKFTLYELLFCVYALGWILDQLASILEHGWLVYTQNLWSFLDVMFTGIYFTYLAFRIYSHTHSSPSAGLQALDILSTAAPVLIPRLAFNLLSENMLFIALRSMMADFTILTFLAVWCFAGFLLSMTWLSHGAHKPQTISKWMLWVWFGLDGTGITRAAELHPYLGPVLMIAFAFLGNTLFLTVLVSILSNTFATIAASANGERQFQRTVLTLEGVKSDAIFAYSPPLNILALALLLPLKSLTSPRWFHKVNVFAIRAANAPLLLALGAFERRALWKDRRRGAHVHATRRGGTFSSRFSVHGDIQAAFDAEPPEEVFSEEESEESEEEEEGGEEGVAPTQGNGGTATGTAANGGTASASASRVERRRRRRGARLDSVAPFVGLEEFLPGLLQGIGVQGGRKGSR